MARASRHLIAAIVLLGSGMLWGTGPASANETLSLDGRPSSAALNFSIIIPVVLRIMENSHPAYLPAADTQTARISASQRMVVVSTLGKGFCMDLQLTRSQLTDWQVQVSGSAGTSIQPSDGGYRLCMGRPGRYELALEHQFRLINASHENSAPALDWPVSMSLATP